MSQERAECLKTAVGTETYKVKYDKCIEKHI